jgi:ribosome-associated protein
MRKKRQLPADSGLSTEEKSLLLARALDEKQGEDILLLDVAVVCPIAERLLLATAKGLRHAQALADALMQVAGERTFAALGMEGYQSGGWILLDFNDIIVHIFQEDARRFYNLEGLWNEGRRVDWCAAAPEAQ